MSNSLRYRLAAAAFSLLLLFILFVTSFEAVCYRMPGLYEKEFRKYNVLRNLSYWRGEEMDMDGILEVMDETMAFLRGNREDLIVEVPIDGRLQEFYNPDEISHMTDVKNLFVLFLRLRAVSVILCLALMLYIIRGVHSDWAAVLSRGFCRTCGIVLAAALALGLLISTDFSKYFVIFHEMFFSQGNCFTAEFDKDDRGRDVLLFQNIQKGPVPVFTDDIIRRNIMADGSFIEKNRFIFILYKGIHSVADRCRETNCLYRMIDILHDHAQFFRAAAVSVLLPVSRERHRRSEARYAAEDRKTGCRLFPGSAWPVPVSGQ